MIPFLGLLGRLGVLAYWLTLPGLWLILNRTVRSRAVVVCNDAILLVKPLLGSGQWMLPGGGLDQGEEESMAAVRELYEETGIQLEADEAKFIGMAPFRRHGLHYKNLYFYFTLPARPNSTSSHFPEILASAWVPLNNLPRDCSPEVLTALRLAGHGAKPAQ